MFQINCVTYHVLHSLLWYAYLQSMTPSSDTCHVGPVTPLPTTLQQRYAQLQAPQCTNLTYINTFVSKLVLFANDADVRNIICHLNEAISSLNSIHVSNNIVGYIGCSSHIHYITTG